MATVSAIPLALTSTVVISVPVTAYSYDCWTGNSNQVVLVFEHANQGGSKDDLCWKDTLSRDNYLAHDESGIDDIGEDRNFHDIVSSFEIVNDGNKGLCVEFFINENQDNLGQVEWVGAGQGGIDWNGVDHNDACDSIDLSRKSQSDCLSWQRRRTQIMKKRVGVFVGVGLVRATAMIAISGPTNQSRPTLESRLEAFGVPAGVELIAAGQDGKGNLIHVMFRDSSGKVHRLIWRGSVKGCPRRPGGGCLGLDGGTDRWQRRLATLISADRDRMAVVRRRLPRTRSAGQARFTCRIAVPRILPVGHVRPADDLGRSTEGPAEA